LREKIARQNLAAVQAQVTHEVIELIAQTKVAFYAYQADLQLEGRLKLIIQADAAGADLARQQHQAGNINQLGELNQQAQLGEAQLTLTEAQKDLLAAREKLDRLMGLSGGALVWSARPSLPPLPASDPGTTEMEELAVAQRRDLLALREETNAVGAALALKTNTRFLPASIDVGVDSERMPDQRVTGVIATLEVPIFDQGQGEVSKLAAQHRQLQRRLQALVIEIRSEAREASRRLVLDRQQATLFRKTILPVNIRSVNQTLEQFNAMQLNTYDLFLAKQRELEAERDYIDSLRDYWVDRTDLEEAVGGNLNGKIPTP
jgi:cobalt-zinc-cadmium efflux system outer membrane protein